MPSADYCVGLLESVLSLLHFVYCELIRLAFVSTTLNVNFERCLNELENSTLSRTYVLKCFVR